MSDLVGNPEDRFSHNEAQLIETLISLSKGSVLKIPHISTLFLQICRFIDHTTCIALHPVAQLHRSASLVPIRILVLFLSELIINSHNYTHIQSKTDRNRQQGCYFEDQKHNMMGNPLMYCYTVYKYHAEYCIQRKILMSPTSQSCLYDYEILNHY